MAEARFTLGVIGGGVMGGAFIERLLESGTLTASDISVAEPLAERRRFFAERFGVQAAADAAQAATGREVVLLAVKPQMLPGVLEALRGRLEPDAVVISIAAGVSLAQLQAGLDHQSVIRAMPNTPAQIGLGVTGWAASPAVNADQRAKAQHLLASTGEAVYFEREDLIDAVTAVSGSGPAYVLLFVEALIDAGVHAGLPRSAAEKLAVQTVLGTAVYLEHSGRHPAALRNEVTTPAGTTAEALAQLEAGGLRSAIDAAVMAAFLRARQLGQK